MLSFVGIVVVAVGILISVSLHEAGHMGTAKGFGMRVTRYFVGFGPTIFSRTKGDTEYGVKALPLGGFVKIVGMTPQDEDADDPKAMWRFPVWKRTIVMAAGSIVHFILAFLIFWGVAATAALPDPAIKESDVYVNMTDCVTLKPAAAGDCSGETKPSAAKVAGMQNGDRIIAIGSVTIAGYTEMIKAIRDLPADKPVTFTYIRAGETKTAEVTPIAVERLPIDNPKGELVKASAVGIQGYYPTVEYNAVEALPVAVDTAGKAFTGVITSLKKFPEKVPKLWSAITGEERDPETPISMIGAARFGGELAERERWPEIFMVLGILNLFIGLFNLLPLLPLDGGHIAIAWFERARSWVYARFSKPDPGRVDYYKLMPLTYTVILIFGAFTVLTMTADIVNPIQIFK